MAESARPGPIPSAQEPRAWRKSNDAQAVNRSREAARAALPLAASARAVLPGLQSGLADWRNYDPDRMTVAIDPKLPLTYEKAYSYREAGRLIWVGRNAVEGSFLVTAADEHGLRAVLSIPGADVHEIQVGNGGGEVFVLRGEDSPCGGVVRADVRPVAGVLVQAVTEPVVRAAAYTVDVAFFFNQDAMTVSGGLESHRTTFMARIEAANQVLVQSGVTNFQWRLAGVFTVPAYATTNAMEDDLALIRNTNNPVGQEVAAKLAASGADQACLVVGGSRTSAGVAQMPGRFAVIDYTYGGHQVLAHELAHNFGCDHDRLHAPNAATTGYNFGHTLDVVEKVNGRDATVKYGTIMSYDGTRIDYFSNPEVSYKGVPTGIVAGRNDSAHNARTLTENAPAVATTGDAPTAPAIITQPFGTSTTVTNPFNFSVVATGGGLTYQWYRNGAAITGATNPVYSGVAAAGDGGTFTVVVTNSLGSVTSTGATLTVMGAGGSTPTPAGGGGGGGGGGAPSLWFGAALVLLGLLKRWEARGGRESAHRRLACAAPGGGNGNNP